MLKNHERVEYGNIQQFAYKFIGKVLSNQWKTVGMYNKSHEATP